VENVEEYEQGPAVKKWIASDAAIRKLEAQNKPASEILYRADGVQTFPGYDGSLPPLPHLNKINIPYSEFREIAFYLPAFEDLPLLWTAWCSLGKPVDFIVRCIEDGDAIIIDTSGYEYARYRAACRFTSAVV
jgi:hypothetical protein